MGINRWLDVLDRVREVHFWDVDGIFEDVTFKLFSSPCSNCFVERTWPAINPPFFGPFKRYVLGNLVQQDHVPNDLCKLVFSWRIWNIGPEV